MANRFTTKTAFTESAVPNTIEGGRSKVDRGVHGNDKLAIGDFVIWFDLLGLKTIWASQVRWHQPPVAESLRRKR
jgi:hypothetical protein